MKTRFLRFEDEGDHFGEEEQDEQPCRMAQIYHRSTELLHLDGIYDLVSPGSGPSGVRVTCMRGDNGSAIIHRRRQGHRLPTIILMAMFILSGMSLP